MWKHETDLKSESMGNLTLSSNDFSFWLRDWKDALGHPLLVKTPNYMLMREGGGRGVWIEWVWTISCSIGDKWIFVKVLWKQHKKSSIRKVFRPLPSSHILLHYSLILFLIHLHTIPQLDWSLPVINSIDWTWFGKANSCLVPLLVHVREKTKQWGRRNCP
jgi:hypothetical protein